MPWHGCSNGTILGNAYYIIYLSIYLFIYLSTYLSIYPSIYLSIYPSIYLSYPILSHPIPSHPIRSDPILSYPILSYPSIYLSIYQFCNCYETFTFVSLLTRCRIHRACHAKPHPNFENWSETISF